VSEVGNPNGATGRLLPLISTLAYAVRASATVQLRERFAAMQNTPPQAVGRAL